MHETYKSQLLIHISLLISIISFQWIPDSYHQLTEQRWCNLVLYFLFRFSIFRTMIEFNIVINNNLIQLVWFVFRKIKLIVPVSKKFDLSTLDLVSCLDKVIIYFIIILLIYNFQLWTLVLDISCSVKTNISCNEIIYFKKINQILNSNISMFIDYECLSILMFNINFIIIILKFMVIVVLE